MALFRSFNDTLARLTGFRIARATSGLHGYFASSDRPIALPTDLSDDVRRIWDQVRPFTMVSPERIDSVCRAVDYIIDARIPGAFVECGVWRGGAAMAAALRFAERGDMREIWLYDTFEGMPDPIGEEVDPTGITAAEVIREHSARGEAWLSASLDHVSANLNSTGYPASNIRMVQGMVEDTIPGNVPDEIAVLRLDTDFYESTFHELVHLVPRIAANGVLIVDDYGHWSGARRAVDEYFAHRPVLLTRVDYSARMAQIPFGWPH